MFLTSVLTRALFPQAEPTSLSHGGLEVKKDLPINSSPWDGLASLSCGFISAIRVQLSKLQACWEPGVGTKLQLHAVTNGEAVEI